MPSGTGPAPYGSRSTTLTIKLTVVALRDTLGDNDFDAAWAEGAAMSTKEAIAYAQRGRGERKRPSSGWVSLTPTELDVVGLVAEGLANKDIADRLIISPRTVQTHLTHVYAKLGLTSRVSSRRKLRDAADYVGAAVDPHTERIGWLERVKSAAAAAADSLAQERTDSARSLTWRKLKVSNALR